MESALEGASGVATSPGRDEIGLYQRGRDRFSAPQGIPAAATCCMMERQDRSLCRGRCRMPLDFGPGAGGRMLQFGSEIHRALRGVDAGLTSLPMLFLPRRRNRHALQAIVRHVFFTTKLQNTAG